MAHGSVNLASYTSSAEEIMDAVSGLYDNIVSKDLLVRRMYVVANHVIPKEDAVQSEQQLDLFSMLDGHQNSASEEKRKEDLAQQQAVLAIRERFGKNAIFKGMDMQDAATTRERNAQVGGHKA